MANKALFDIDLDGEDHGFDATPSATHEIKLRSDSGVNSVQFQVYDPDAFDGSLSLTANPPLASKDAELLELVGSSTGQLVSPATLLAPVEVTMPASDLGSWIVRCIVNGGQSLGLDGHPRFDPDLVWQRMIVLRNTAARLPVATERQEYEQDGLAGAVADLARASYYAEASETLFRVRLLSFAGTEFESLDTYFSILPETALDYGLAQFHRGNIAMGSGGVIDPAGNYGNVYWIPEGGSIADCPTGGRNRIAHGQGAWLSGKNTLSQNIALIGWGEASVAGITPFSNALIFGTNALTGGYVFHGVDAAKFILAMDDGQLIFNRGGLTVNGFRVNGGNVRVVHPADISADPTITYAINQHTLDGTALTDSASIDLAPGTYTENLTIGSGGWMIRSNRSPWVWDVTHSGTLTWNASSVSYDAVLRLERFYRDGVMTGSLAAGTAWLVLDTMALDAAITLTGAGTIHVEGFYAGEPNGGTGVAYCAAITTTGRIEIAGYTVNGNLTTTGAHPIRATRFRVGNVTLTTAHTAIVIRDCLGAGVVNFVFTGSFGTVDIDQASYTKLRAAGATITNGAYHVVDSPLWTRGGFPSSGKIDGFAVAEEFIKPGSTAFNGMDWLNSGTAGVAFFSGDGTAARQGLGLFDTGTISTGYSGVYSGITAFLFGGGVHLFRADVYLDTLSVLADRYQCVIGFLDGAGSSTDAAQFRYNDSVNGGRWQAVTRSNAGVENATDTGITPVAGTFANFEIRVNALASEVLFYINGALVATHSDAAKIPSGAGRGIGFGVIITKTTGTTNRRIGIDRVCYAFEPTSTQ
jgi:hypothetical protein